VFSPYWTWCSPDNVTRAQELGLAVLPWTVNEVADLEAVRAAGVDGLVTDYPDRWTAV
jgi:glycerophosphoryl diester phosphodiesterase